MQKTDGDVKAIVLQIVSQMTHTEMAESVTPESRLKQDLGFDSLSALELCVALESALHVSVESKISGVSTVQDLIALVGRGGGRGGLPYDIEDYPLPKTESHIQRLKGYMRRSRLLWRFAVSGLDNLPSDGRYILCPNHQSYYDCLWIWAAIGSERVNLWKIACLAAEVFLPEQEKLTMLGGIPVERSGNTVPAMKRALACVKNGYTMLIHPEGTRTRDGKMQAFKGGAAKLAIDAGV
ncbi:MAG: 1-acyl-sn-glycerol-3-phosphate acyltransferase, partial [Oscillospiraceae bacterium]|nr:1-acyl-sn-glycerol-3-phosphate acyltransferase [Oscillospiraceae bacterium]